MKKRPTPPARELRIPISVTLSRRALKAIDRLITLGHATTRSGAVEVAVVSIEECAAPLERSLPKEKRS